MRTIGQVGACAAISGPRRDRPGVPFSTACAPRRRSSCPSTTGDQGRTQDGVTLGPLRRTTGLGRKDRLSCQGLPQVMPARLHVVNEMQV